MWARYILAGSSLVFLTMALIRAARLHWRFDGAARTWLCIGGIFAAVSGWLFRTVP